MAALRLNVAALHGLLRDRKLVYLLGLLLTLLIAWLHVSPPGGIASLLNRLDSLIYDQRFNLMPMPERDPANNIVIVDIDERSLQAEGRFPWDRFKLARLLQQLDQYGVLVAGFDINFPEPQRNLVSELLNRSGELALTGELQGQLQSIESQSDADQYFAQVIADTAMDVVMAVAFNSEQAVAYGALPASVVQTAQQGAAAVSVPEMLGYTGNIEVLQQAAAGAGHITQQPDIDGVVRRVPLLVAYQAQLYPTLALEMARVYFFEENIQLLSMDYAGEQAVRGVRLGSSAGQYELRTDINARVLVPYVGPSRLSGGQSYTYVSATDVLNGRVEPALLENALVLIDTTAPGLFDLRATPVGAVYPGVEVHANILNALLKSFVVQEVAAGSQADTAGILGDIVPASTQYFPYKPDWEAGGVLLALLGLGLLLSLVLPRLGPTMLGFTALALLIVVVWLNFWLWSRYLLDLSLALIIFLVIVLSTLNMTYGFLVERFSRKTIKGMFDQYVPPAHIDAMLKNPDQYSFAGESREMTVMFSDIRNFTSISESLSATELKTLLNDFFTPVTGIIFENQGTIDKYVGDMVMAFWGAPMQDALHRDHAVSAALQILEKVEELRAGFRQRGLPDVSIGVGLNSGVMNVGDMGSVYRRSYTVLGDAVNLGSRLEALTKYYGVRCLIGENTFAGLDGFLCRLIDKVKVKGKDLAVRAYEPVTRVATASPELQQQVAAWNALMEDYFARRWDETEQALEELQSQPELQRLCEIYRQRISILRTQELPPDWDGAFEHSSK